MSICDDFGNVTILSSKSYSTLYLLTDKRLDMRAGISTLGAGERVFLSTISATRGSTRRGGVFRGWRWILRGFAQAATDRQGSTGHDDSDDFVYCAITSGDLSSDLRLLSSPRSTVPAARSRSAGLFTNSP